MAAYHHPDDVRKNPKVAWNINITSLSYLINKFYHISCLFYFSTEMVYGEGDLHKYFTEGDRLNPINLYGKQKQVAEAIVLGYGYNVVRLPFLIGSSLLPSRKHFYDTIVDTIISGKKIEMFCDAYKSALDFDTATEVIVALMEMYNDNIPKILNVSGDEVLSKYDIGANIAKKNGLNVHLVKAIELSQNYAIFHEKRADCTLLDNTLVKQVLGISTLRMKF